MDEEAGQATWPISRSRIGQIAVSILKGSSMKAPQRAKIKKKSGRDPYKLETLADIKRTFREEDRERHRDCMPPPFRSRRKNTFKPQSR
jgi:hypothetical protein